MKKLLLLLTLVSTPSVADVICKNEEVPEGWVIIRETGSTACHSSGTAANAWTVIKPGIQTTVCDVSPIPSHCRFAYDAANPACPGSVTSMNAKSIKCD